MISRRAQALLKTLIEHYIAEGQPVGSRTLSRFSGLELSPASIRNVMADLEEQGFIASPHTSAGRVPTARGYRFFVDTLLRVQPLDAGEIQRLESNLLPDNPQRLVAHASQLLSDLTRFAGVVMVPKRKSGAVRQIEFLGLSEKRVVLIIITTDGEVQNRVLVTEHPYTPSQLVEASNFLNQHYAGLTFEEMEMRLRDELAGIHRDMTALMNAVLEAGRSEAPRDDCVISGERNLLDVRDVSVDLATLRRLFEVFEQKTQLLRLLDVSQKAHGVQIFIGGESGIVPLDEFSVVTAPYEVNGEIVGTVGVIGPTRMAYDRVIPIVDITARLLSSALSFH